MLEHGYSPSRNVVHACQRRAVAAHTRYRDIIPSLELSPGTRKRQIQALNIPNYLVSYGTASLPVVRLRDMSMLTDCLLSRTPNESRLKFTMTALSRVWKEVATKDFLLGEGFKIGSLSSIEGLTLIGIILWERGQNGGGIC